MGGLLIISFFFITPLIVEYKKNNFTASVEIQNKSKKNFEKVLTSESLKSLSESDESTDVGLNLDFLLEDIFPSESQEDTIRWSKKEIEKIFEDNGYTLSKVRRTKLVQPIYPDHLPEEMKSIESTKKRKSLFIKIILPLILYENNQIKTDRIKLFNILNKSSNSKAEKKWLEKIY